MFYSRTRNTFKFQYFYTQKIETFEAKWIERIRQSTIRTSQRLCWWSCL